MEGGAGGGDGDGGPGDVAPGGTGGVGVRTFVDGVVGVVGEGDVEKAQSLEVEALEVEAGDGGRRGLVGVIEAGVVVSLLVGEAASRSLLTVS